MDRTRTAGRAATPFAVRIRTGNGDVEDVAARAVIDASGTYLSPNSLSSSGLELLGMSDIAAHVTPALPDVLGRDRARFAGRSEEHTSELQSLMRISYAVFCLKKKKHTTHIYNI